MFFADVEIFSYTFLVRVRFDRFKLKNFELKNKTKCFGSWIVMENGLCIF